MVLLIGVACGGDDEPDVVGESVEVTINADGVTPGDLRLSAPDQYQLTVNNESGAACTFALGGLVRDLEVADGESETVTFVSIESGADETIEIGCGDERTATAVVEMPGG
jgi:hypothetical protein